MGTLRTGSLALLLLLIPALLPAQEWDPWEGMRPDTDAVEEAADEGPEIRDPFFHFCIGLMTADSLGVWTGADLLEHARELGRESRLPQGLIRTISRRAALPQEVEGDWTARTDRRWVIELNEAVELPLPYSILGYHPGTLHAAARIEASEWTFPASTLRLPESDPPRRLRVHELVALRIDAGHFVLDVDGWLDRLLGKKLDDTWVEAFVVGRVVGSSEAADDGLEGIALGRSRGGRALSGSFDFRHDKVLPNGRPVANALSRLCRRAVAPVDDPSPRCWSWKP